MRMMPGICFTGMDTSFQDDPDFVRAMRRNGVGMENGVTQGEQVESADQGEAVNPGPVEQDEVLGEPGKRALVAERKRAADAERRVRELESQLAGKANESASDLEALQARVDALTAEASAAKVEAARARVIAQHGVPEGLEDFLAGQTEDELSDSAVALMAAVKAASSPGVPAPDPSQGSHGVVASGGAANVFADFVSARLN